NFAPSSSIVRTAFRSRTTGTGGFPSADTAIVSGGASVGSAASALPSAASPHPISWVDQLFDALASSSSTSQQSASSRRCPGATSATASRPIAASRLYDENVQGLKIQAADLAAASLSRATASSGRRSPGFPR